MGTSLISLTSLERSDRVAQGVRTSMYLVKVLTCNIRACERIMGVSLPLDPSQQAVISQYADDTTIFCDLDDAVDATFEIYALYEKLSGTQINITNSKGLWLGLVAAPH